MTRQDKNYEAYVMHCIVIDVMIIMCACIISLFLMFHFNEVFCGAGVFVLALCIVGVKSYSEFTNDD